MVGFANFTHQYDYRLGETPFYRRGAMGKDPLKTFFAQSTQARRANASRIRDMRFANSSELNADIALRSKREQMISGIYSGKRNPEMPLPLILVNRLSLVVEHAGMLIENAREAF